METIRVFDSQHDHINDTNPFPEDWHPMCEFNCVDNDAYHGWIVGEKNNSGGWLSPAIVKETDVWLLKAGANPGETVLIRYCW